MGAATASGSFGVSGRGMSMSGIRSDKHSPADVAMTSDFNQVINRLQATLTAHVQADGDGDGPVRGPGRGRDGRDNGKDNGKDGSTGLLGGFLDLFKGLVGLETKYRDNREDARVQRAREGFVYDATNSANSARASASSNANFVGGDSSYFSEGRKGKSGAIGVLLLLLVALPFGVRRVQLQLERRAKKLA